MMLMQMIFGKIITQAVSIVARFKLADQLASGAKTAAELAPVAGLNAGHLYRVLRAVAGIRCAERRCVGPLLIDARWANYSAPMCPDPCGLSRLTFATREVGSRGAIWRAA